MRLPKRTTAGVLAVLLSVQATGCTGWKTVTVPAAVSDSPRHQVQVVLLNGGTITADSVTAGTDSLVTYQKGAVGKVALAQVKEVKVRATSPGKTVGLFLGITVVLLGLFALFADAAAGS